MIQLEDLKPIIEPLLNEDNTADIIDQIKAIDKEPSPQQESEAVAEVNRQWAERYRKAFFEGISQEEKDQQKHEEESKEENKEEEEKPSKFEDLFKQA